MPAAPKPNPAMTGSTVPITPAQAQEVRKARIGMRPAEWDTPS